VTEPEGTAKKQHTQFKENLMKRLSWKYIAGLVDGEGCIDAPLFRDKRMKHEPLYIRPRIRVTLAIPGVSVLEALKANHGGTLLKRTTDNPHWQDSVTWSLEGKKLRPFLQNIANHMEIKKEQALLAIWIQDHLRKRGMQFSEEPKQCACKEMKAMKTDPQRLSETAIRKIESCDGYSFWSSRAECCVSCGTTDLPHEALGMCSKCYGRHRYNNGLMR
jgi:hypothetical protein